ncbi:Protein CBG10240 [Caenorhabditis briggsae]|uniref:Protein CBG10240 n=1 Tax=Caenorhabditis briggsae TaxID=6238 RepID=A8XAS4_CAEBR|nr:Protein CBG10240 [Caenorhabditis briggsae]CAP29739.1 Protein CBG10240 [Caenorhabditis briggsae]
MWLIDFLNWVASYSPCAKPKVPAVLKQQNKFEPIRKLGKGTFGEVWLVRQKASLNYLCAIKYVPGSRVEQVHTNREISIHLTCHGHQNVIRIHSHQMIRDDCLIVEEYANNGTLHSRICSGYLTIDLVQRYFKQLIAGLRYIHEKGIVHHDIKPRNLLLSVDNVLKIADFGCSSRFRVYGKLKLITQAVGTTKFWPPECFGRYAYHAQPVDIWSAGIVLYYMVAREVPWNAASEKCYNYNRWKLHQTFNKQVLCVKNNEEIQKTLGRVLETDPCQRATLADIENSEFHKCVYARY